MKGSISEYLNVACEAAAGLKNLSEAVEKAAALIIEMYQTRGKLIIFGNGGSAADAQHIATELVSRFRKERGTLSAIALTTNTSLLTAISNDYSFDDIFSRQIEALASENDIVMAISTSGNSPNVLKGVQAAKDKNLKVIAFTGKDGGKIKDSADILINVPSDLTSHIQECHITVGHLLCHIIEQKLF